MSPSRRIPKYRHYKPKNLAVVRIGNRDHYLGQYDSPESHEKYHRLIAEWLSGNCVSNPDPHTAGSEPVQNGVTIGEILVRYCDRRSGHGSDRRATRRR